jgi:hypothetical protein
MRIESLGPVLVTGYRIRVVGYILRVPGFECSVGFLGFRTYG